MGLHSELASDKARNTLPGGTAIHTAEVSIDASTWTALIVPSGISDCKGFFVKSRAAYETKISSQSDGSAYLTVGTSVLGIDIAVLSGSTLAYLQSVTGADTIEVLFWY